MYFNSDTLAFVDGEFIKAEAAQVGAYAQSLHYGYAVFEGVRAYATPGGTRIFKAQEHYERLHYSCRSIGLPFGYSVAELTDITYQLLAKNGLAGVHQGADVSVGQAVFRQQLVGDVR